MSSLSDPSAVVPGRTEAEERISRFGYSLSLLVAPCSVRCLPFPEPPTKSTQTGMNRDNKSSWEQGIWLKLKTGISH